MDKATILGESTTAALKGLKLDGNYFKEVSIRPASEARIQLCQIQRVIEIYAYSADSLATITHGYSLQDLYDLLASPEQCIEHMSLSSFGLALRMQAPPSGYKRADAFLSELSTLLYRWRWHPACYVTTSVKSVRSLFEKGVKHLAAEGIKVPKAELLEFIRAIEECSVVFIAHE